MNRVACTLVVVSLALSAAIAQAQETGAAAVSVPAATRTQADCTGFIANPPVPRDLFVVGGGDDDFHSVVHQFVQGDSIFISQRAGVEFSVGAEYSVIRPANVLFHTMHYAGERWALRALGQAYEDVAQVRVTHVNPTSIVALVTFSCGPIMPGDTVVPFQSRMIPEYTLSKPLDHFAPLVSEKEHGTITASENNFGFLGRGNVIYVNLGERDGMVAGQRFRIYKVLPAHPTGFLSSESVPPETIGEAIVLSVQSRSCVAIIVSSYREIAAGDYVEKE